LSAVDAGVAIEALAERFVLAVTVAGAVGNAADIRAVVATVAGIALAGAVTALAVAAALAGAGSWDMARTQWDAM
jgi:choline-glycine betaine transporter